MDILQLILNYQIFLRIQKNDETFYEKRNTLNEVHRKINTLKTNKKNIFNAVLESLKQKQKNFLLMVFLLMDQEQWKKLFT